MYNLNKFIVSIESSIKETLQLINENGKGIAFVTNNKKLVGVVTDGDLRRYFLKNGSINSSIKEAMNENYISLNVNSRDLIIKKNFNPQFKFIPLLDDQGEIVDIADNIKSHRISLMEPDLTGNELKYLSDCIETNWISSQGNYVNLFESFFEKLHPNRHALTVSNGTVAILLALKSLGIGEGDEVIVPDITFAATINAVIHCGATPVLCEIDPYNLCLSINEFKKLISKKTKAVIPVHLYGQPCDMEKIVLLAKEHDLLVIEDCAEAIGSTWKNKIVGTFGDAATFSFFGNKTISTGEGGMLLFKDQQTYEYAKILRDHGMNPKKRYWHDYVGYNFRLTNLQASVGVAQCERLDEILAKKDYISDTYTKHLSDYSKINQLPFKSDFSYSTNWLYTIILDSDIDRDYVISQMLSKGIDTRPVFYPLHEMKPYKNFKRSENLSESNRCSYAGISLPSFTKITDEMLINVVQNLKEAIESSFNKQN